MSLFNNNLPWPLLRTPGLGAMQASVAAKPGGSLAIQILPPPYSGRAEASKWLSNNNIGDDYFTCSAP